MINGDDPHIYMEIRRGMKLYKHQMTTNEELAQLAFAGFMRDPFTGKEKKAIFDTDYKQSDYLLNEFYHRIFHYDAYDPKGILFKKEKTEIDELLFIHYLYKEAKKVLTKYIKQELSRLRLV